MSVITGYDAVSSVGSNIHNFCVNITNVLSVSTETETD